MTINMSDPAIAAGKTSGGGVAIDRATGQIPAAEHTPVGGVGRRPRKQGLREERLDILNVRRPRCRTALQGPQRRYSAICVVSLGVVESLFTMPAWRTVFGRAVPPLILCVFFGREVLGRLLNTPSYLFFLLIDQLGWDCSNLIGLFANLCGLGSFLLLF